MRVQNKGQRSWSLQCRDTERDASLSSRDVTSTGRRLEPPSPRPGLCVGGVAEALRVELLPLLLLLHGELLALVRRGQLVDERRHAVRWNDQSCGGETGLSPQDVQSDMSFLSTLDHVSSEQPYEAQ